MSDEVDGALLGHMRRDDAVGLSGLYDRHAARVLGLACRMLGKHSDAEDVVQEVFLQAWKQRHQYDETRGAVLTWLMVMTRSRALDRLRAARSRIDARAVATDLTAGTGGPTGDVWLTTWARTALASLPAGQRLVIELAYFAGYTHREIATLLRQPLGTVKTRIRLALLKLREADGEQLSP